MMDPVQKSENIISTCDYFLYANKEKVEQKNLTVSFPGQDYSSCCIAEWSETEEFLLHWDF